MSMRNLVQDLLPPIVYRSLKKARSLVTPAPKAIPSSSVDKQDLDLYWDPKITGLLDHWGEGNVWNEIQLLLANCAGKTLDIACGTGKTMEINSKHLGIELFGCDISEVLIAEAVKRGLGKEKLKVCDATKTDYSPDEFEHAYSIGSLEHFTNLGIDSLIAEARRIVRRSSFHMVPVSRSGKDEGWFKTIQSFHNNSVDWWKAKFQKSFPDVRVLDSVWNDDISVGKWFVCNKSR